MPSNRADVGDEVVLDLDVDDDPHLQGYDGNEAVVTERIGPQTFEVDVLDDEGDVLDDVLVADHEMRPREDTDGT